jgi:hypothetical protein
VAIFGTRISIKCCLEVTICHSLKQGCTSGKRAALNFEAPRNDGEADVVEILKTIQARVAKSVLADLHVLLHGFSIEDERHADGFTPQWVSDLKQRKKVSVRYRRDGSHAPMHELHTPGHRTEVRELVLRCVIASYQYRVEPKTRMTSCFGFAIA